MNAMHTLMRHPKRQRGAAMVLIVAGMVAILAAAGLAFDVGHLMLNKSRLQGVVDAAALSGAKALYDTRGSTSQATAAANAVIAANASTFPELARVLGSGLNVSVDYSALLSPFTPGTAPPNFVRVTATNFSMWTSLSRIVGVQSLDTAATAVSGPIPVGTGAGNPEACDLAPIMVCGDPNPAVENFGYPYGALVALKLAAQSNPSDVGPGNYHAIRLGGNGANVYRDNLGGIYEQCLTRGSMTQIETQPGNLAGPTEMGINTRFNDYNPGNMSPTDFPPDVITTETTPALSYSCPMNPMQGGGCAIVQGGAPVTTSANIGFNYQAYSTRLASGSYDVQPGTASFRRREIAVPVANCNGAANGQSTLPVLGFACFFLLQRVQGGGSNNQIFGEAIRSCRAGGNPGGTPGPIGGSGPERIVLYDDVRSPDS